jgi:hypothetical protein
VTGKITLDKNDNLLKQAILFAAAPELLAALKRCVLLCRAERSDSLVGRFRAIREANAPPPDGRKNPYELMLELRED